METVVISVRADAERPRVKWWREGNLLVDSYEQELSSDKIILYRNGSLQVRHVQQEDSGEYVCQTIRPIPWGYVTQVHEIEVMCEYASVTMYAEINVLSLVLRPNREIVCIHSKTNQRVERCDRPLRGLRIRVSKLDVRPSIFFRRLSRIASPFIVSKKCTYTHDIFS